MFSGILLRIGKVISGVWVIICQPIVIRIVFVARVLHLVSNGNKLREKEHFQNDGRRLNG